MCCIDKNILTHIAHEHTLEQTIKKRFWVDSRKKIKLIDVTLHVNEKYIFYLNGYMLRLKCSG